MDGLYLLWDMAKRVYKILSLVVFPDEDQVAGIIFETSRALHDREHLFLRLGALDLYHVSLNPIEDA